MVVYEYARADIVDMGSSVYALRTEYTGICIQAIRKANGSKLQAVRCMYNELYLYS